MLASAGLDDDRPINGLQGHRRSLSNNSIISSSTSNNNFFQRNNNNNNQDTQSIISTGFNSNHGDLQSLLNHDNPNPTDDEAAEILSTFSQSDRRHSIQSHYLNENNSFNNQNNKMNSNNNNDQYQSTKFTSQRSSPSQHQFLSVMGSFPLVNNAVNTISNIYQNSKERSSAVKVKNEEILFQMIFTISRDLKNHNLSPSS